MSLIDAAFDYVYSLFRDNAGGHDLAHTLRVYQNAMLIAQQEPDCDLEILALAPCFTTQTIISCSIQRIMQTRDLF